MLLQNTLFSLINSNVMKIACDERFFVDGCFPRQTLKSFNLYFSEGIFFRLFFKLILISNVNKFKLLLLPKRQWWLTVEMWSSLRVSLSRDNKREMHLIIMKGVWNYFHSFRYNLVVFFFLKNVEHFVFNL